MRAHPVQQIRASTAAEACDADCLSRQFSAVLVGAGAGTRLGSAVRKSMVLLDGRPLWWHAARTIATLGPRQQVLVLHADDVPSAQEEPLRSWLREAGVDAVIAGGATRQDSVLAGVRALSDGAADGASELVLIHDAARPLVSAANIQALLDRLRTADAALLASAVTATVQRVDADGFLVETLDRSTLRLASTPQGARRGLLLRLLERASAEGLEFTDEAALWRHYGVRVAVVADVAANFKVTTQEDLSMARALVEAQRVGHGYDIHRLVPGGPLRLAGVDIPVDLHLQGHSDGDAVLHAVIEALLGAAGLADIGEYFPDTDPALKNVDSRVLLQRTLAELRSLGLAPAQLDCSVLAERPRLSAHKPAMKAALCELLGLPPNRVALKARTNEGMDAIGRGEAIAVHALATLRVRAQGADRE